MILKDKRVTVMGLGLHGGAVGTVSWLANQGASVLVTDMKSKAELTPSLEALSQYPDITYVLGEHRLQDFTDTDLVVRNPGVPGSSEYLAAAKQAGIPIEMDSSLFFLACPTKDIIGVTGSKGKTTTAKAITAVLTDGGHHVVEVGTDGASPLGGLPSVTEKSIVVFELSSWRLEALAAHSLSPHTAVVTSLLPDHLNTYDSMEAYAEVKKGIIRYQGVDDTAYINMDDARLRTWKDDVPSTLVEYSLSQLEMGTLGILLGDISLIGDHQKTNMLPAIHIGRSRGIDIETIKKTLSSFDKIPHRLEFVRTINGVDFVNNSAATIPEATIAAITALNDKSLVLILGGGDKKLVFDELAATVSKYLPRHIVWLPGTATDEMRTAVHNQSSIAESEAVSMTDAVAQAYAAAEPGDTVLLSPSATSFGLFLHEFDRGDQFRDAVLALN